MKKVLFLMFLLLLIGLVTASLSAQVRIGGNTAPSAAAVLDLNASDAANTGKGGLVLPRVDLQNNTMRLNTAVPNVTGTMVYNVTTTLGRIGVYYWNGNSWVLASLPSTSAADSGQFLMSTGSGVIWRSLYSNTSLPASSMSAFIPVVSWRLYTVTVQFPTDLIPFSWYIVPVPGMISWDFCAHQGFGERFYFQPTTNALRIFPMSTESLSGSVSVICLRASTS